MNSPFDKSTEIPTSRTQRKKADHARKALGEALVALPPDQAAGIDLPAELREAVALVRKTRSHGARRRQIQYIGTLLRRLDVAPIQRALKNIQRGDLEKAQAFKRIETWRNALLNGNDDMIAEILAACPLADRQQLRQLVRNARRDNQVGEGVSASRKLFKYLRNVLPLP